MSDQGRGPVGARRGAAPEIGLRIRELLASRHRMILGLSDDELGYILEPEMFTDREYRYETTMSLGLGTVGHLLDAWRGLTP